MQVCADVTATDTLERETRALHAAAKQYPRAIRRLLVVDRDARVRVPGLQAQPAYEWLLAAPG